MPTPKSGNPFAEARNTMAAAFTRDEGLSEAYVSNVAMLLHDRFNKADFTDHETRNRAGKEILHLVFMAQ